ncbi:APC family permease [Nocardioides sp. NPDC004968]|uniref:APC family permease n=1 Tax=Nocardioides sp. NPDC004968 TaxID=3155894 RepID=UPI0033B2A13C
MAALALDAMASVSYGPEAIVLVLALAGGAGIGLTLPVTIAIAVLLALLVASYRSVIAAFPDGGGAYAVSRRHLGSRAALVAAASLIIDYVLNVAVSVAAGVAALTSAFPALLPYAVWVCLGVLALVTLVNLGGIAHSARVFMAPTVLFVGSILAVIVVGLFRSTPLEPVTASESVVSTQTVGVLLLLKAFSSGCAALTGVEAIANAVPSFRAPKVRRAQAAEVALGGVLGVMLIGLAVIIEKFDIRPREGVTVLSQLTSATLGDGFGYYLVQIATVVLLALAANTSFGGLPTLLKVLAADHYLPHRFAHRSAHDVHRWGVLVLAGLSAVLLVAAAGQMNTLVPLFAIGVFVGFTLAQVGMVVHWRRERPGDWWRPALPNLLGAVATAVAAMVTTAMKLADGAWLVVVVLVALALLMASVRRRYASDERPSTGRPSLPRAHPVVAVVPVKGADAIARRSLATAMSLAGEQVVAVHVCDLSGAGGAEEVARDWDAWGPPVPLVMLSGDMGDLAEPVADYIHRHYEGQPVLLVLGEPARDSWWDHALSDGSADRLEERLGRVPGVLVCRSAPVAEQVSV